MKNFRGVTLIELLVVLSILSILAIIAIPGYIGQQKRAARAEAYANLDALRLLEEQFFADEGDYTASLGVAGGTTAVRDANLAAIQAELPGFQPGDSAFFSYRIIQNVDLNGNAQTPCFHATATGVNNTRVDGDSFNIDCNNNRDF